MGHQHYPRPAAIEAYGNGGFRFAGMSHRGSILCLPSGIYGWPVTAAAELSAATLMRAHEDRISLLLLGMGERIAAPSAELRAHLAAWGISLDPMDTGAAARTYNMLLAEGRAVGAALIATP